MISLARPSRRRFRVVAGLLAALLLAPTPSRAQEPARHEGPIIDMHLHPTPADGNGPPPMGLCVPVVSQVPHFDAREHFEELARKLEGEADAALDTPEAGLEDAIAVLRLPDKCRRR